MFNQLINILRNNAWCGTSFRWATKVVWVSAKYDMDEVNILKKTYIKQKINIVLPV
jgi:hypothetical protein